MTVQRLRAIPGIGVDKVGDAADARTDPEFLRLENLDTDLRPPEIAIEATRAAVDDDDANSYLPFQGHRDLRAAAADYVGVIDGQTYDPATQCVSVAGGLNGILNVLLATVEPGREVVICDPIYAGLVNRILLTGGVPRFVTSRAGPDGWTVDPDEFASSVGPDTAAVLTMSPAMPTGAVLGNEHWDALAPAIERHDCWIVHNAAMERLRFDGQSPASPATHPALADRVITVGSASKELRMIGWRVGWVVGPQPILADITLVGMANVVCQVGIAQHAVASALSSPDIETDIAAATTIWAERCNLVLDQLSDYACIPPHGGWSILMDTRPLGLTPAEASSRLFERAKVATTAMSGWGPSGGNYLRLVFSNEPTSRLKDLKARFDQAFSWG